MDFKEWEGKTIMNNVEGNSIGILFFHQFDWWRRRKGYRILEKIGEKEFK